jgi:8-oxo-dGTP diphosphatase
METLNTMQTFPVVRAAAIVLVNQQNEVLLAERPAHKPIMPLYWEFPGGKLEAGETSEMALFREAREEIGIELHNMQHLMTLFETRHCGKPECYSVEVEVFISRDWLGEVAACERQALRWVKPEELRDYKLLPANFQLIPAICLNVKA